jgi:hypothetical protein
MPSTKWLVQIVLLGAVLFGSFFITLWLTAPDSTDTQSTAADNRSDLERLAARHVSDNSDLLKAAREIGLRSSRWMKGNIDLISRISEHDVNLRGWVADTAGDASPASILVFAGGAMVATTQTKGERPDVTEALHLAFGSEKNTSFSVNFSCRPGEPLIILGIGTAKQYIALNSNPCP